jgi:hypothetical protein
MDNKSRSALFDGGSGKPRDAIVALLICNDSKGDKIPSIPWRPNLIIGSILSYLAMLMSSKEKYYSCIQGSETTSYLKVLQPLPINIEGSWQEVLTKK